jgi:hypothetical protein
MKKLILIGGIGLVIIVAILAVWALIAGIGFVYEKFPHLITAIENITGITIEKAKEALPVIEEKAKEISPEITEKIAGIIPGEEIPAKDVGGEDIAGIPRYPNMIRVSFNITDGKRTIGYMGKVEFSSVIDFYNKEMSALKFKKKVLSSSAHQEVHEYRKAKKTLEFTFKKADRLGIAMTEMVIREL